MEDKSKSKVILTISFTADLLLLSLAFFISNYIKFGVFIPEDPFYYTLFLIWEIIWILLVLKFNLYEIPRILYIDKQLSIHTQALITFVFLSATVMFFITDYKFSRIFFITTLLLFSFFVLIWKALFLFFFKKYRTRNKYKFVELVFIGFNTHIKRFIKTVYLDSKYGYEIKAIFTEAPLKGELGKLKKGELKDAIQFIEKNKTKEIVISLPQSQAKFINELLQYADNNLIRVSVIPEFSEYLSQVFTINYIENIPVLKLRREPLQSLTNRILKRGFDVAFSSMAIVFVFSWLFPIIAILIKLTSKGPVFFAQDRTGRDGQTFKCYKFRSMEVNGDSDNKQATKHDARITKVGAMLRKTSLDELPQIINVLLNNMSLVGPRPHMLKHTEEYRLLVDKFMVRHFAKPGVTGWAQILGFRGETKTVGDMKNRAMADIWYIENWSFMLDLKIILRTVWTMLFKKDANAY